MVRQDRAEDSLLTLVLKVTEGEEVEMPDNTCGKRVSTTTRRTQSHQEVDVHQVLERSYHFPIVPSWGRELGINLMYQMCSYTGI